MVAGLHRDANELRMKRLELDRAVSEVFCDSAGGKH